MGSGATPPLNNITASFDFNDGTEPVVVNQINQAQVDPKAQGQQAGLGWQLSGIVDYFVAALGHWLIINLGPLLTFFMSLADSWYAALALALTQAQGQNTPGFFTLSAALVSDLFGTEVSAASLQADYASGGRLASIQALGSQIVGLLATEFMGGGQTNVSQGPPPPNPSTVAGLPLAQMSEAQGLAAAETFLGFAAEFGVREGNAELFAGSLPYGLGEGIRSLAVAVAKGVNLGRMGRVALMPLFRGLVATPLQWAINAQYRPQLLGAPEAIDAWYRAIFSDDDLETEMARHGYSEAKISALKTIHGHSINPAQIRTLVATGRLSMTDFSQRMLQLRWAQADAQNWFDAEDALPAREVCLSVAKTYVEDFAKGSKQLTDVSDMLAALPFLTPGEISGFNAVITATAGLNATGKKPHLRQLSPGQWKTAYYAGLVTENDLINAIAAYYPDPTQQQIVFFEDLLGQAKYQIAQDKLATAAAKYGVAVPILPKLPGL